MKKVFIIALCLIAVGSIVFVCVMAANHWDFSKLVTQKLVETVHNTEGEFDSISIMSDTADIEILMSDDEKCRVECYEYENEKHTVSIADGTLKIESVDERKWYEHIGITAHSPSIKIFLPEKEYRALSIDESTGDISIKEYFKFDSIDIKVSTGDVLIENTCMGDVNIEASTADITLSFAECSGNVGISASTGDIQLSSVNCDGDITTRVSTGKTTLNTLTCKALRMTASTGKTLMTDVNCTEIISEADTGDITMKNVIAVKSFNLSRSTGDVFFDMCDAGEIFVQTSTGDVTGTLISDKIFFAESDTGHVEVPKSTVGECCEISTDTGDINISVVK